MASTAPLVSLLTPGLPDGVAQRLADCYLDVEQRFFVGDWEPAELDAGQFCEAVGTALYLLDAGVLNWRKSVSEKVDYLLDANNSRAHSLPRQGAKHVARVVSATYGLRSQRGAIHISPDYTANELDVSFLVAAVRWMMAECVRMVGSGQPDEAARAIKSVLRVRLPAIWIVEDRPLVVSTLCSVEEEILLLLSYHGEEGTTRRDLGRTLHLRTSTQVSRSLAALTEKRQVFRRTDGRLVILPPGTRRLVTEVGPRVSQD